ncbi:hypothetical protein QJS10_CPA10g00849 [Acorus calamus]|uniref:Uncharacterized protein n=1 Tax=Acorus calamus TaxID=4465 RepID=A0AAV9DY88_ACOCL|nr:hypothetical protein QJS10_CPA10g00849 [Acorus calamus]
MGLVDQIGFGIEPKTWAIFGGYELEELVQERATTTMEEIPNSAPNETLIKVEAPKLVSLLKEMKNRLDVLNITFI